MDTLKYTSFFHDGSILDIQHHGDNMVISMESSEMDEEDLVDDIVLSKNNRILGRLYLENIQSIKVSNVEGGEIPNKYYDSGEILRIRINTNDVFLLIEWTNYPPKPRKTDVSKIEIKAEKIWWENIPGLPNGL